MTLSYSLTNSNINDDLFKTADTVILKSELELKGRELFVLGVVEFLPGDHLPTFLVSERGQPLGGRGLLFFRVFWLLFWFFGLFWLFEGDYNYDFLLLCTVITLLSSFLSTSLPVPSLYEIIHIKSRPLHFLLTLVPILLTGPYL